MTGKIRGVTPASGTIRARGQFMRFYSTKYQRWIVRSWPKGMGADTPLRAAQRANFSTSVKLIKSAPPEDRVAAQARAQNTPYLERDLLMAGSMGTQFTLVDGNGRIWESAREAMADIQTALDNISNVPGSMLVRTDEAWQALRPGVDKYVLTYDAVAGLPFWQPSTGGGGSSPNTGVSPGLLAGRLYGPPFPFIPVTGAFNTGYIFFMPFYISEPTTLTKLGFSCTQEIDGRLGVIGAYTNNAGVPDALIAQSAEMDISAATDHVATDLLIPLLAGWSWLGMTVSTGGNMKAIGGNSEMGWVTGMTAIGTSLNQMYTEFTYDAVLPATITTDIAFGNADTPLMVAGY